MKYFAKRRHSLHTRNAVDRNGLGNDPLTGVANLFDIGLVFIVGLIITIFSAYNLQDLLSEKSEMTILKMSKNQDRMVYRRADGNWANKRNDSERASSVHSTQKAAEDIAREMLRNQDGGELATKGRDGKIRSNDTIPPGNDPCPPKDREH